MSRVRTRPTRDDTRDKLFEAAARVFEQDGIGGASIEAIAAAAGFTRGAFYSNFKSKDELIIAMLEDHVEQSIRRIMDILTQHNNLDDFIAALKAMDRTRQDPLGRSPLLQIAGRAQKAVGRRRFGIDQAMQAEAVLQREQDRAPTHAGFRKFLPLFFDCGLDDLRDQLRGARAGAWQAPAGVSRHAPRTGSSPCAGGASGRADPAGVRSMFRTRR